MLSETNNAMSELVYLFVDGESSALQNELLFKALASSSDLQQELQEAILIRSTLEQDSAALAVPLKTTANIFQAAGVSLPSNVAVGAIIPLSDKIFLGLKSMAVPVITAIGTAVASLTIMNYLDSENIYNANINLSNSNQIISNQNNTPNNNINSNTNNSAENKLNSIYSRRKSRNNNINTSNEVLASKAEQVQTIAVATQEIAVATTELEQQTTRKSSNITQSPMASRNNYFDDMSFAKSNSVNNTFGTIALVNHNEEFESIGTLPLTIGVRGMMNLSSFPAGTKSNVNTAPSNFTLSIGYDLSDDFRIGIEGGRQSIRYYTFENGKNDKATQRESIDWAGAYIRKTFNELTFSNLTPFANGTLGATVSGPSARLIAGMKWQPENSISLSAGVEASTLFYQKSSNWQSISALGFIYQVEINY